MNAAKLEADCAFDRAQRDYLLSGDVHSLQTGEVIDGAAWAKSFEPKEASYTQRIAELNGRSRRLRSQVVWVERVTLSIAVTSMLLLVVLAWSNF